MCGARSFACKWCRDRKTARSTFQMEREDATKERPPAPFGISAQIYVLLMVIAEYGNILVVNMKYKKEM